MNNRELLAKHYSFNKAGLAKILAGDGDVLVSAREALAAMDELAASQQDQGIPDRECKIAIVAILFGAAPFVIGLIKGSIVWAGQ